ncbi:hypothetical protein B0O99DRAFT_645464 [Bisporella sp. PMI_857]|nr:hypothetical protein B0O99DRAFT_645464 [Bisporella sp. PMI_857]
MPITQAGDLRSQWSNPGDVLSLLLLVGADIVKMAITQLVGYTISPLGRNGPTIGIAPAAFSFGWVAYGFANLLSAVGEKRLIPTADCPSILVNCANAFTRVYQSWALGRLLQDHETGHEVDSMNPLDGRLSSISPKGKAESIRIDIFELGVPSKPSLDLVWWLVWVTIVAQLYSSAPCHNGGRKMAGRTLDSDSVTCLTRANGYLHIMVFIGRQGSWDFESLATATSIPYPENPAISLALALLWACLLISVASLKEHAWYLVGIGGMGMLQSIYAAGAPQNPSVSNFHLKVFSPKPTIIGKRQNFKDDVDWRVDIQAALADVSRLPEWSQSFGQCVEQARSKDHT